MPTPPLVTRGKTSIPAALLASSLWFGLIACHFFSAVLTLASISTLLAARETVLAKRAMMAKPVAAYKFLAFMTIFLPFIANLGFENLFVEIRLRLNTIPNKQYPSESPIDIMEKSVDILCSLANSWGQYARGSVQRGI